MAKGLFKGLNGSSIVIGMIVVLIIVMFCSCSSGNNDNTKKASVRRATVVVPQENYFYDPSGKNKMVQARQNMSDQRAMWEDSLKGGGFQGTNHANTPHPSMMSNTEHARLEGAYDSHVVKQIPRAIQRHTTLDRDGMVYGILQNERSNYLHGMIGPTFNTEHPNNFKGVL